MPETRFFYHSFPRPRDGEPRERQISRGLGILRSIKQSGLILAPEIVEWHTPVSIGSPSPTRLLQQRICFTELTRDELNEHSRRFGSFAIEFDIVELRRAGALPVMYIPQALSKDDHLALIGSFVVSHLNHILHTINQIHSIGQYRSPDYIERHHGVTEIQEDCEFNLRNVDSCGNIVQEFTIPWRSLRDFVDYIGFENAPFDAMTGAVSIAQSLFYPTDNKHIDEVLGYYRQREWRITAGYNVNGIPRGRPLVEDEKDALLDADKHFWNRQLADGKETFLRLDKAAVLSEPNQNILRKMMSRLIVPTEVADEVRKLFNDVAIDTI